MVPGLPVVLKCKTSLSYLIAMSYEDTYFSQFHHIGSSVRNFIASLVVLQDDAMVSDQDHQRVILEVPFFRSSWSFQIVSVAVGHLEAQMAIIGGDLVADEGARKSPVYGNVIGRVRVQSIRLAGEDVKTVQVMVVLPRLDEERVSIRGVDLTKKVSYASCMAP